MMDFKLSDEFVDSYRDKEVPWGYADGVGNSLAELVFLRTYSRKKEDGTKETWVDTCRRVVEGMFTIQKRHCRKNYIEWKNDKAQRTAKDAFDRLFHMKWLPAGRGLWAMGTPLVMEKGNSAPLQSCAFISSNDSVTEAMTFLFDASMLGVGVGFDTDGAGKFFVHEPVVSTTPFVIPDSREGWVESLRILLDAYLDPTRTSLPEFDYSEIRPEGSPIKQFGGVASGPAPLQRMHGSIGAIMANAVGRTLSMRDIADIGNIIGTCVVAGNVRRCLPEGTKVHTTSGLVNIEDIKIGDTVEVAGKTAKVSNFFDQGVQDTVIVKYDGGQIECTPNHRLAVFDTLTSWTFKRADELTSEDRLVWDRHGITGVSNTQMPAHNHVKRSSDTTGQDIVIPDLDADSAWLIGLIHGDGYVHMPSGEKPNGQVMIASAPDTPEVLAKAQEQLSRYNVRVHTRPPREDDGAFRVYAYSSQLADYMYKNVKQANTSITIPDWIKTSTKEIRAAYLAGLMDADGSYKTRPLQAVVTIYPELASQVVDMYASLGIQARAKLCRPAAGNWKALYTVDIVGGHNIRAFEEMISQYSMKRGDDVRPSRSMGGATFSTSMVREAGIKGPHVFNPPANRQNAERVEKVLGTTLPALPYQVLEVVPSGRSVQTYDIEVEDIHQFTANGLVVHNSAEILFVDHDSDDLEEFLELKNYEKNPDRAGHGWLSNNSVRAKVGDDLSKLTPGIMRNGEPGVVWMDVIRNYGRLKDEPDYKDVRVQGLNPCSFSGDTIIHTTEGPQTIEDLKDRPFYALVNGEPYLSPVGSYITGRKDLFTLKTEEGFEVTLTDNHEVLLDTGEWVETGDLNPGDNIIIHDHSTWSGDGHPSHEDEKKTIRHLAKIYGYSHPSRSGNGIEFRIEPLSLPSLQDLQRALLRFGVYSEIEEVSVSEDSRQQLVISGDSFKQYVREIGVSEEPQDEMTKLAEGMRPEPSKFTATFKSLEFDRHDDVWDLSVTDKRAFDANGLYVHNSEQPLESGETCVSGDTMIQTSEGLVPIKDRVGKITKIWNGEKWSPVLPFYTGKAPLYRVHLSDGSYLDATPSHFWDVKTKTGAKFNKLRTSELVPGMRLNKFSLERPVEESDEVDPLAYSYGWVAGDGFVDGNKVIGIVQTAHADKVMPNLAVKAIYPQQNFSDGSPKTYNRVVLDIPIEDGRILRAGSTLPERVLSFNQASLREFFSAWIDTDGTVSRQRGSDNYRIYGSEGQIRLGQMLLRRLGINHASVKVAGRKGDVTNMGVRNKDLYYLNIPSYESSLLDSTLKKIEKIGSRFKKNNAYAESNTVDSARVQKVVSVEKISDEEDTYCFSEHERGMGVFGNVLTYQCVLVETFVNNCEDREDFIKTLKVAYLYGKTVTLTPTKWERTNTIMQRNRRIGLSASGVADFVDIHGMAELRELLDDGFNYVIKTDRKYSEWLCVRESIRHTTMKPSGSISILAGSSPGTHWTPGGEFFIRRITFSKSDSLFQKLTSAGYEYETLDHDSSSAVVLFPIHSKSKRASSDVPAWEKIHLASEIQHWWSDNAVSCTVDFKPEEAEHIPTLLSMYDGKLKGISFLPAIEGGAYKHMPYEQITQEEFEKMSSKVNKIDFSVAYSEKAEEAEGEKYCSTDVCEIKEELADGEDLVAVPMIDLLKK